MNIRLLAGAAAIAAAAVLAYGGYQLLPQGPALTRSEVIGELDGPPLAAMRAPTCTATASASCWSAR